MRRVTIAAIFAIITVFAWSYTETFYMTAGGNGDNTSGTGTWTTSPESLAHAMTPAQFADAGNWAGTDTADNKIGPNDVVLLYDDDGNFTGSGATPVLQPAGDGLSGAVITIMADTGESPVVDGQDSRECMEMDDRDYLVIEGIEFTQGASFGITAESPSNITIRNCAIHDSYSGGSGSGSNIYMADASAILIEYNNIYNATHDHGIYFGGVGATHDDIVVQFNHIYDNGRDNDPGAGSGAGVQFNSGVGGGRYTNVVIRFNWLEGNGWGEVIDQDTSGMVVYGNILVPYWHGIVPAGDAVGPNPINGIIYNNSFYGDMVTGLALGWGGDGDATGYTFKNNALHNTNGGGSHLFIGLWDSGNTISASDYNRFYNPASPTEVFCTNAATTYQNNLAAWQSATSLDANSLQSDPGFATPGSDDFTLGGGSICIDTGADLGDTYDEGLSEDVVKADFGRGGSITLVDRDAGGATGDGWDIGAYEMSGEAEPPAAGGILFGGN